MWQSLAKFVLKNRFILLGLLLSTTILMGYFASKVKLSYEFSRAIPTDNAKYQDYVAFKKIFGEDGNMLVLGVQSQQFYQLKNFKAYQYLTNKIKKVHCVEEVLSIPDAVMIEKDSLAEKLISRKIFNKTINEQNELDSSMMVFNNLPFYNSMLYNANSKAYLMAVKINKDSLSSPARVAIIDSILSASKSFETTTGIETKISGLPLIRTIIATRIQKEMKFFLIGSLLLSVLILLLFFRSVSTTLISMGVVLISVVWALAMIYLCGYKITLLTALIPSLVVVIGIPNCIYFINKYHTSFLASVEVDLIKRKYQALVDMVSKMGVVTLFCNITAAIGFAVFALTKSAVLKEFGVVSGISIMLIFIISFVLLPAVLSFLPTPPKSTLKYLENRWIVSFLNKVENWVFTHKQTVLLTVSIVLIFSIAGIFRLKSVGYIVDDLPKTDKIYTDLKFFEQNFKGIMPLEIIIDSKKRKGLRGLKPFYKADSLAMYIASQKEMARPLSLSEGLKFATQGFNDNDSAHYTMPGDFEAVFLNDYLNQKNKSEKTGLSKMLGSFIDTSKRYTRISVNMADVGTEKLPLLLADIQQKANQYFDTSYKVTLTGTSITFMEGSKFIINGLKESILWAFLFIAICMLYLFRSIRVLICSLLPNLIPLIVTAGIMGWAGVPLKPSTVLIFSVALGIAVDITIRFLVNFRQILPSNNGDVPLSVRNTVQQTGLSIIYTSLVLTAGFIIFCGSSFGGTFALGWLTSVTLVVATLTNLIFLPVLLLLLQKRK
jgi:predicted RND superfamily exporter protein